MGPRDHSGARDYNGAWDHNGAWGIQEGLEPQGSLGITRRLEDHKGAQESQWRLGTTMGPSWEPQGGKYKVPGDYSGAWGVKWGQTTTV